MSTKTRTVVKAGRSGLSLTEVLLALALLATGGLVVYSASVRNVTESVWSAEKIFIDGLLNDLVVVYQSQTYCDLKTNPNVVQALTNVTESTCQGIGADPYLEAASSAPTSTTTGGANPIADYYQTMVKSLAIRRIVLFQPKDDKQAVVTCIIRYRSQAGPDVETMTKFPVFRREGELCP
jgi:Tfp pilus assembly protein PilV